MVIFDRASLQAAVAASARRLVPLASAIVVKGAEGLALLFMPHPRVTETGEIAIDEKAFVDPDTESLVTAIVGDAPSEHWGEGDEAMLPIPERCAWEAMPEYDHLPARY